MPCIRSAAHGIVKIISMHQQQPPWLLVRHSTSCTLRPYLPLHVLKRRTKSGCAKRSWTPQSSPHLVCVWEQGQAESPAFHPPPRPTHTHTHTHTQHADGLCCRTLPSSERGVNLRERPPDLVLNSNCRAILTAPNFRAQPESTRRQPTGTPVSRALPRGTATCPRPSCEGGWACMRRSARRGLTQRHPPRPPCSCGPAAPRK